MNKRTHSLLADLSFQAMLVLMFAGILLLAIDSSHLAMNGIILCIVMVLLIVTYFTSMRIGLILDILFIFLLLAYVTYQAVGAGIKVTGNIYFWIVWPLLMVLAISGFMQQHWLLDEENKNLKRQMEKFVTIDDLTQMNNLLAFERDANVYMNISRRYKLDLVLILWNLAYQDDLERILGKQSLDMAMGDISDSIKNSLRGEDLVYLVENKPYMWGTLHFSKPDSAEVVVKHVSEAVRNTNLKKYTDQTIFSLEIASVIVIYEGSTITPLSFLAKAKRRMWKESDEEYNSVEAEEDAMLETANAERDKVEKNKNEKL